MIWVWWGGAADARKRRGKGTDGVGETEEETEQ